MLLMAERSLLLVVLASHHSSLSARWPLLGWLLQRWRPEDGVLREGAKRATSSEQAVSNDIREMSDRVSERFLGGREEGDC